VEEVRRALASPAGAHAAHLQPVAFGEERPGDVIAVKLDDVQRLADATPWGDEEKGSQGFQEDVT
jgi:hypothetical protein